MTTPESLERPAASVTPKHLGIALLVISMAQLMVVLDATIVNIALISIQKDLLFSAENLQWVITAYTL
ncbi:MAG: MFS transporter, partial [Candidatus Nanopelagicales bacterium]